MTQFDIIPRYWTSEGKAEIDFLIQFRNKVVPVEVKAERNIRSKSLQFYEKKYHPDIRIRYSLQNLHFRDGILNIPIFMADNTKRLLEKIIN